ncbi:MAG TPA: isoleucine--tRNA ligase [Ilumatobacteraceae bacterium]|nr:isoleucine--tRNA ligase [Ilumatobacteraceae bacterium]
MYPEVDPQPFFPQIETDVLASWAQRDTFKESIRRRADAEEYVFYDGPPFANGLPHYGHLLTGFVKDAVPRYQTMRGKRVERRFGWDCHGLPAEVVVEKELGISGHPEITKFGIDKFNDACRTSVLRFTDEWQRYVTRQARWVDFENDYKTLDLPYMESVMWAFKTLWDKGLIYEGFKVLAYCWRCETPLSNTETRMDDVYRDRQDPALTVQFQLDSGERILAWTTTPWTLPSNLALAVGPDIDYAVMEEDGVRYILAESRLAAYERELANAVRVETIMGSDLVGRHYTPLFPFFADTPNAFRVLGGDFVSTEDGTGIVHMAPGFGEDDQIACNAAGIPTLCPMDEHGRFTAEVPPWVGQHVFDANTEIVKELKARGVVVRHDNYNHSYPHCWRCAEPLVYRAISSWFVQVSSFRDRMGELNQQIQWVPEHVKEGSFGKWLANARDWSISRNRFWGSPIPVWRSDDPAYPRIDVYGSLADLQRDFGVEIDDLHRPFVDNLVRPNPDDPTGKSSMRRVTEVLDCWFESGSMPFAQVHYPFENAEWFESHYPGDFIVEYMAQTRGWFYTLHVLATALFDRPSFRTCISHGIVLGDDGQKMSKSLNNYPDPMMVFDTYGADAMRWYLLSSTILRGGDLAVTENGIRESVRHVVLPIWNTYSFFTMYANAAGHTASRRTESSDPLDQYILGKLHALVTDVTVSMDAYDLFAACGSVRTFLDVLTNWYVRRSRERFWAGDPEALDVLWTVLTTLCQVAAPLLPLTTEAVYRGLVGADASVHLTDWPTSADLVESSSLVAVMDRVRDVCSASSAVRKATGRRVRQPLASMTIAAHDAESLAPFRNIIADEINVKDVVLSTDLDAVGGFELTVVPGVLGPRIGKDVQKVIAAVKKGEWTEDPSTGVVTAGGIELQEGEYSLRLVASDPSRATTLPSNTGVVVLDTDLTPELEAEGLARDLVRLVQQARRDAGLNVSDRIALRLGLPDSVRAQVEPFASLITEPTLALSLVFEPGDPNAELDGEPVSIGVTKI